MSKIPKHCLFTLLFLLRSPNLPSVVLAARRQRKFPIKHRRSISSQRARNAADGRQASERASLPALGRRHLSCDGKPSSRRATVSRGSAWRPLTAPQTNLRSTGAPLAIGRHTGLPESVRRPVGRSEVVLAQRRPVRFFVSVAARRGAASSQQVLVGPLVAANKRQVS